jgi:hypothetical protein
MRGDDPTVSGVRLAIESTPDDRRTPRFPLSIGATNPVRAPVFPLFGIERRWEATPWFPLFSAGRPLRVRYYSEVKAVTPPKSESVTLTETELR